MAVAVAMSLGGTAFAEDSSSYLSVLNQERASRGVAPLQLSADLVRVAQSWSDQMARSRRLQHNPHLQSEVANWWSVGENVGVGPDLRDLEQAFWDSAEHRANILDKDYTDVGIAATFRDDRLWMTVVFRQPWHHVTHHVAAAPAPRPKPQPQPASHPIRRKPAPTLLLRGISFTRMWTLR